MDNPFSWDYLTTPLREMPTFGPFSLAFFILFVLTFVVSAVIYFSGGRFFSNQILRDAVDKGAQIMMWLTATGLFFFAWRIMRIDFGTLYMRFWSYLFLLLYIGTIGYFIYWYRTSYRSQLDRVEAEKLRRQYNPQAPPKRRVRRKARRGVR